MTDKFFWKDSIVKSKWFRTRPGNYYVVAMVGIAVLAMTMGTGRDVKVVEQLDRFDRELLIIYDLHPDNADLGAEVAVRYAEARWGQRAPMPDVSLAVVDVSIEAKAIMMAALYGNKDLRAYNLEAATYLAGMSDHVSAADLYWPLFADNAHTALAALANGTP